MSASCLRAEEAMEREGDGDTNCSWCTWNDPLRIEKGTEIFRKQRDKQRQSRQ